MIAEFITAVKTRGLARTNRYEVIIPFGTDQKVISLTSIFCDQLVLPGVSLETTAHRVFGETREMPYERIFNPVQFSFYNDSDFLIKAQFDNWMNSVMDPTTRVMRYYADYTKDITIKILNIDESNPYTIKLHEAYPKTIQDIQMDASSKEVMKVSVTLLYRYWTAEMQNDYINTEPDINLTSLGISTNSGTP